MRLRRDFPFCHLSLTFKLDAKIVGLTLALTRLVNVFMRLQQSMLGLRRQRGDGLQPGHRAAGRRETCPFLLKKMASAQAQRAKHKVLCHVALKHVKDAVKQKQTKTKSRCIDVRRLQKTAAAASRSVHMSSRLSCFCMLLSAFCTNSSTSSDPH